MTSGRTSEEVVPSVLRDCSPADSKTDVHHLFIHFQIPDLYPVYAFTYQWRCTLFMTGSQSLTTLPFQKFKDTLGLFHATPELIREGMMMIMEHLYKNKDYLAIQRQSFISLKIAMLEKERASANEVLINTSCARKGCWVCVISPYLSLHYEVHEETPVKDSFWLI